MKLAIRVADIGREGAAVLAVSIDTPEAQRRLAEELKLTFPLLSDPSMSVIRAYGMKGERMDMADMGYVVIDTVSKGASGRARLTAASARTSG